MVILMHIGSYAFKINTVDGSNPPIDTNGHLLSRAHIASVDSTKNFKSLLIL